MCVYDDPYLTKPYLFYAVSYWGREPWFFSFLIHTLLTYFLSGQTSIEKPVLCGIMYRIIPKLDKQLWFVSIYFLKSKKNLKWTIKFIMNSLFLLDPLTEILKLFVLDIRCNYFSLQPLGLNDRNTLYRRATSQH